MSEERTVPLAFAQVGPSTMLVVRRTFARDDGLMLSLDSSGGDFGIYAERVSVQRGPQGFPRLACRFLESWSTEGAAIEKLRELVARFKPRRQARALRRVTRWKSRNLN